MGTPFAGYLGQTREGGFSGFTVEDGFFAIIELEETGLEHPAELLKSLASHISQEKVTDLSQLETQVLAWVRAENLPMSTNFACALLGDGKAYVKTMGGGEIYIKRGRDFARLIGGDKGASGYVQVGDYVVLTTKSSGRIFVDKLALDKLGYDRNPHELVEEITPQLKAQDDAGTVALFVQMTEHEHVPEVPVQEQSDDVQQAEEAAEQPVYAVAGAEARAPALSVSAITGSAQSLMAMIRERSQMYGRKKTLTLIAVAVIFFVFLWSVVLSNQRRVSASDREKIQIATERITQELDQAEEVAFLNLGRAQVLLAGTKEEYDQLKKDTGGRKYKEIEELGKLISSREGAILKKENKKEEEFFDLSVESENASGSRMYLSGDTAAVLDKNGAIYVISLPKKSLDTTTDAGIRGASLIAYDEGQSYFYRAGRGIYRVNEEGKVERVIENDKDWGGIRDMYIFNGNIYVLDSGRDQVYKYVPTEKGFSEKSAYIKGKPDLNSATSLAIDSAVYVSVGDGVVKYLSGVQDTFATSYPQDEVTATKVITSDEIEKVYVWDRDHGAIYILAKSGSYEREINAAILKKASDVVVYDNTAYVLEGQKIYTVGVE